MTKDERNRNCPDSDWMRNPYPYDYHRRGVRSGRRTETEETEETHQSEMAAKKSGKARKKRRKKKEDLRWQQR